MAAQWPSADTDSAKDLGLVTDTDLSQLDAGLENGSQVFYQKTEINAPVCRKIEEDFIVVKGIFRLDQLHVQVMLENLLLADAVGFFFVDPVRAFSFIVVRRRHAEHFLQRIDYLVIAYFSWRKHNASVFDTPGGLDDHMIIHVDLKIPRVEIVYFSYISESYAYNSGHLYFNLQTAEIPLPLFGNGSSVRFSDLSKQEIQRKIRAYVGSNTYPGPFNGFQNLLQIFVGVFLRLFSDII